MRYTEIHEALNRKELERYNDWLADTKRNIRADEIGELTRRNTIGDWYENNPGALQTYIDRGMAKRELKLRGMPTSEKHIQWMMKRREARMRAIYKKHKTTKK